MENISSGAALQKQIASIMDELAKAAVAEISKVVDDGVVMLRLEICEREHEIDSLKRNLQMVSEELRDTRRALVRQCVRGTRSRQPLKGSKENDDRYEEREAGIEVSDRPNDDASDSRVVIKLERMDDMDDDPAKEDDNQCMRPESKLQSSSASEDQPVLVWSSSPENNLNTHDPQFYSGQDQVQHQAECHSLGGQAQTQDLSVEAEDSQPVATDEVLRAQPGPGTHSSLLHKLPGFQGDFGTLTLHLAPKGRPMELQKRFACTFCSKSFDRLSHLDRHQRIHTGEKPFSCMLCGRCFTQKSSLKSHLKTHRGFSSDAASLFGNENKLFSEEWKMVSHREEQIAQPFNQTTDKPDSHSSYLSQEDAPLTHAEEESIRQTYGDQTMRNKRMLIDLPELFEKNGQDDEDSVFTDYQLDEPRHSGSDSIPDEDDSPTHSLIAADCVRPIEQTSSPNHGHFQSTSTVLNMCGVSKPENLPANQIYVKEEDDTTSYIDIDKRYLNPEASCDPNMASPTDQNSATESLRTSETAALPEFTYDVLPQRRRTLNRRERRFLCGLCGKMFDRLSHLDRHQRVHTGEKPYSCGTCGRSFTQKSSLKGHMRTHTTERGFSCSQCGMSFPTRASHYRHHCNQYNGTDCWEKKF